MNIEQCPICKSSKATFVFAPSGKDIIEFKCLNCGEYNISGTAYACLENKEQNTKLSYAVRIMNNQGESVNIMYDNIESITNSIIYPSTIKEKANIVMEFLYENKKFYGNEFVLNGENYVGFGIETIHMMRAVVEYLIDSGYCTGNKIGDGGGYFALSSKGIQIIEDQRTYLSSSNQAFVAMSFDESLIKIYDNGIKQALIKCGYIPKRIDDKGFNGEILTEIIKEIKKSSLLIADFTYNSNGVYFEAGAGTSLGLNLIYSCQQDDFEKLHFDVNHINYIKWKNEEDLYNQLVKRIKDTGLNKTTD